MQAILFVPGFCGSHLYRRDTNGDRWVKLWLSQVDVAFGGIADLDTDPEVSPAVLDKVRPAGVLTEVYYPFLDYFARLAHPVFQFGYDFRADVATNGQRLVDFIDQAAFRGVELSLVGHSMGGLVIAAAMARLTDQASQRVRRVITCATPWRGAYRTVELFAGKHETVQKIVALNQIASRRSVVFWLQEALRTVASWPGAYDLMPMPDMMNQYLPGAGQDFRTDGVLSAVNPWFSVERYNEAVARRPIQVGAPPHAQWYNLRGVGRPTSGPMPTVADGRPYFWFNALLGDSTVPEYSSWPLIAFEAIGTDFDADHEQFMNDHKVCQRIARIVGVIE